MAAGSDDDMTKWIECLRGVLKMYGHCGNTPLNATLAGFIKQDLEI